MAAKINERLKDLLEAGQGTAIGMATGMSPQRALLSSAGDMMLTKVLGPAAGVATIFLGISRTLAAIIRQSDVWGRGMERMRSLEQIESGFATILKSAALAKERMRELSHFAINSPFKVDEVMHAARSLELLTKGAYASRGALTEVGDAAAAANQSIGDTAFVVGKLYNFLQSGRSIQNLSFHLQNMGIISGELQNKLELMQNSGAGFTQMWAAVQQELGRAKGGMADNMRSLEGLQQRLQNVRDSLAAKYGESFIDQEKNAIYATIKATEALSPVMKTIGRDVSLVTGVWRGWTADLKKSAFETWGFAGALQKLWAGFTVAGGGILAAAGVGLAKFATGVTKGGVALRSMKKLGRGTAVAQSLNARADEQRAASGAKRDQAMGAMLAGSYLEAGQLGVQSVAQRGMAFASSVWAESAGAARIAGLGAGLRAARAARKTGHVGEVTGFSRRSEHGFGAGAMVLEMAAAKSVQMAMTKAATATAAKATATTLLGKAAKTTVSVLGSLVTSLGRGLLALGPWGWAAAAAGAAVMVLGREMLGMHEAAKAFEEMGKAAADANRALREQVKNISTVEDKAAALASSFKRLRDVQSQLAEAKDPDQRRFLKNEEQMAKTRIESVSRIDPRKLGRNKQQQEIEGQRRYFEQYEAPRMELAFGEGIASPAGRLALAQADLELVQKNRQKVQDMDEAAASFSATAEGAELERLIAERASYSEMTDAGEEVDRLNKEVETKKSSYETAATTAAQYGYEAGSDRALAARRTAKESFDSYQEAKRRRDELVEMSKEGNEPKLREYLQKRAAALTPRIEALQRLSPEPGVAAALLAKDARDRGDIKGAQAIEEQGMADAQLRQAYGGAAGAAEEKKAALKKKSAEIELAAYRSAMELERALLDEKELGYMAEQRAADARVDAAKRDLALAREKAGVLKAMGQDDAGIVDEAKRRVAVAVRDRAVVGAQHTEARRQAEAPLKEMEARNAIGVAMLGGNVEQAAYLQDEEKRRQLTERLYNARVQGLQSGLGGDEAVGIEKRKIMAEQQAEFLSQYRAEQEQALATVTDPGERKRIERGLAFRNRISELTAGGMEANAARSKAEGEFGGYSSDLSAADSAAGFFLAGRGNVEGRLATDMANFNANMVSPSATAEEQAKKSTSLTDVLKSLDQKIKDASSVLVMKEGGK